MNKKYLFRTLLCALPLSMPLIAASCDHSEIKVQINEDLNHLELKTHSSINGKSINAITKEDFYFSQYFDYYEVVYNIEKQQDYIEVLARLRNVNTGEESITKRFRYSVSNNPNTNGNNITPETPSNVEVNHNLNYDLSNNYYASLNNLEGQNFVEQLRNLTRSSIRNYSYFNLYDIYVDAFVDKYYENNGTVLDIYTENINGAEKEYRWSNRGSSANNEGQGINREHIIPQSWFGKEVPMVADAHHVWPTDIYVNKMHGNYPYGTVVSASYISKNGTKVGTSAEDGQPVTEVIDEFKGDVARAILYFAFAYKNESITQKAEASRFFNSNNEIRKPFLDTMIAWHKLDPVSQFDFDRNNGIAKHQVNRNPFIDYPELVDVIFGNKSQGYQFINKGIVK
ncbi:Extracellular ribonuclease precursor [Metamycoplasma cloacale]|uniref:Ribonuclease n=1 Tax=Metamycoplasma cloacale TaxID=92401 RepID=A0A2Z4LLK6_9BACT|nr:endonuclease [Metamycoplasma cloacale]AWX42651.1 ribonuclease [Metamycoplasma cloacale]VEU79553.1 Extracellular ribonuclease precursor [Metamycoplasma cloacale]